MDVEKILLLQEARRLCLAGKSAEQHIPGFLQLSLSLRNPKIFKISPSCINKLEHLSHPSGLLCRMQPVTCPSVLSFLKPQIPTNVPKFRAVSILEQKFKSKPYWDEIDPTLGFKSVPVLGLICRMKGIEWQEPLQFPRRAQRRETGLGG